MLNHTGGRIHNRKEKGSHPRSNWRDQFLWRRPPLWLSKRERLHRATTPLHRTPTSIRGAGQASRSRIMRSSISADSHVPDGSVAVNVFTLSLLKHLEREKAVFVLSTLCKRLLMQSLPSLQRLVRGKALLLCFYVSRTAGKAESLSSFQLRLERGKARFVLLRFANGCWCKARRGPESGTSTGDAVAVGWVERKRGGQRGYLYLLAAARARAVLPSLSITCATCCGVAVVAVKGAGGCESQVCQHRGENACFHI
jgi:hypothetical protein